MKSRLLRVALFLIGIITLLASSDNPPNGRTGAPFDGACSNCHSGNNPGGYNAVIELSGLPNPIPPDSTFAVTLTVTTIAGSPFRAGFQLVAVQSDNTNAGDLEALDSETGTEMFGSREYIDHRNPKKFNGNPTVSWTFNWTSPSVSEGGQIHFYFTTLLADGNGSSGDYTVSGSQTFLFAGSVPLSASIIDTDPASCFGAADGAATVAANGGNPPYDYAWPDGQTTSTAFNLASGTYEVTVTDSLGLTATASAVIEEPDPITISPVSIVNVECAEDHDGQITVAAGGGVTPYAYHWSHGAQGPVAIALVVGTYTVSITDANGCTQTWTGEVVAQDSIPPLIACMPDVMICDGDAFVFDFPAVTDNCGLPLMITQTEGLPSGSVFPLGETLQTFEVADQSGNTAQCSHTITVSPVPELAFDITGDVNNEGTGAIQATVGSGNVIQYFWIGPDNFTAETADIEGLVAGVYLLTATDANGCSAEYAVQVPLVVGTDNIQNDNTIKIYPNPATDHIRIEATGFSPVVARLYDARGRLFIEWDAEMIKAPIDVSALPAGVYMVVVFDDKDNRYLLRWVKME
ncbi:MAG: T9SS type A sorting domain-containing protein [Saprospiraceae bacterium]|nr:T9SS type A sorting domain-containing protein [Saprospiraceae bacterium]